MFSTNVFSPSDCPPQAHVQLLFACSLVVAVQNTADNALKAELAKVLAGVSGTLMSLTAEAPRRANETPGEDDHWKVIVGAVVGSVGGTILLLVIVWIVMYTRYWKPQGRNMFGARSGTISNSGEEVAVKPAAN